MLLYVRSNYKWYLKNKIPTKEKCVLLQWSSKRKHELALGFKDSLLVAMTFSVSYQLGYYTSSPLGMPSSEKKLYNSLVISQDGLLLLCSPLSHQCPSPPMSAFELSCSEIPSLIHPLSDFPNHFVCLHIDSSISLWSFDTENGRQLAHIVSNETRRVINPADFRYISEVNGDKKNIKCEWNESEAVTVGFKARISQSEDGKWTGLIWKTGQAVEGQDFAQIGLDSLKPGEVKRVEFVETGGKKSRLTLTEGNELKLNDEVIAENCTSFVVDHGFILFTSMTQGLFDMLHIHSIRDISKIPLLMSRLPKTSTGKDHHLRNIERGSEIVSISDQRVVFELPRGNLEIVYPKILLFQEMKRLIIVEKNFLKAYKEIRRHKLDMNLIPDISPTIFEEEVRNGNFLKAFRKPDDLNLILNSLEKEVCPDLAYMYSGEEFSEIKQKLEVLCRNFSSSKVNYVCSVLKEAMDKEQDHFILSIVMTYTRQQPPQLSQALEMVKSLQGDEDELCDVVMAPHLNPTSSLTCKSSHEKRQNKKGQTELERSPGVSELGGGSRVLVQRGSFYFRP